MGLRGRKRRLELEAEYWRLLTSGMGTVEACLVVGIGRKTGYRRRAENGGVPPVRLADDARANRYLSLLERQQIATPLHGLKMPRCWRSFSAAASCPRAVAIAELTSSGSICSPGKLGYSNSLRRRRSEFSATNGPANWART